MRTGMARFAVMLVVGGYGAIVGVAGASGQTSGRQVMGPLAEYTTYLVATHFLRGESYETHHYFKPLREGVLQGLVFRRSEGGAPLIEVEWAISQEVFDRLPDWQKDYWHPLAPAVDAGRIRLPGLAAAEEQGMLRTIRGLYAQTINLAGIEGGELPLGLEGVAMVTHITREEMIRALTRVEKE